MNVYLNKIDGYADAFTALYMSKRSWTREMENEIRSAVDIATGKRGQLKKRPTKLNTDIYRERYNNFLEYMDKLVKYGVMHITLLKFIDFSITVEGLHRAGQDDWDSHAVRFNNRIIRSSTRLAEFSGDEISDWYEDKIIPMDLALEYQNISVPNTIEVDGVKYIRSNNGYIREDMKNNKDVKRGLYMECIPSNFIFKVNLADWAHVYKLRNRNSNANPEVKILCERIADLLKDANPYFTRKLFKSIEN